MTQLFHHSFNSWLNVSWEDAEMMFIKEIMKLPHYGMHFNRVLNNKQQIFSDISYFVAVTLQGIRLEELKVTYGTKTHKFNLLFSANWDSIERIIYKSHKFVICLKVNANHQSELPGVGMSIAPGVSTTKKSGIQMLATHESNGAAASKRSTTNHHHYHPSHHHNYHHLGGTTPHTCCFFIDQNWKGEHLLWLCHEHHMFMLQRELLFECYSKNNQQMMQSEATLPEILDVKNFTKAAKKSPSFADGVVKTRDRDSSKSSAHLQSIFHDFSSSDENADMNLRSPSSKQNQTRRDEQANNDYDGDDLEAALSDLKALSRSNQMVPITAHDNNINQQNNRSNLSGSPSIELPDSLLLLNKSAASSSSYHEASGASSLCSHASKTRIKHHQKQQQQKETPEFDEQLFEVAISRGSPLMSGGRSREGGSGIPKPLGLGIIRYSPSCSASSIASISVDKNTVDKNNDANSEDLNSTWIEIETNRIATGGGAAGGGAVRRSSPPLSSSSLTSSVQQKLPASVKHNQNTDNNDSSMSVSGGAELAGIFIKNIIANSLAEKCGLLARGDQIMAVNDQPLDQLSLDQVSKLLRNEKYSTIRLKIKRRMLRKTVENDAANKNEGKSVSLAAQQPNSLPDDNNNNNSSSHHAMDEAIQSSDKLVVMAKSSSDLIKQDRISEFLDGLYNFIALDLPKQEHSSLFCGDDVAATTTLTALDVNAVANEKDKKEGKSGKKQGKSPISSNYPFTVQLHLNEVFGPDYQVGCPDRLRFLLYFYGNSTTNQASSSIGSDLTVIGRLAVTERIVMAHPNSKTVVISFLPISLDSANTIPDAFQAHSDWFSKTFLTNKKIQQMHSERSDLWPGRIVRFEHDITTAVSATPSLHNDKRVGGRLAEEPHKQNTRLVHLICKLDTIEHMMGGGVDAQHHEVEEDSGWHGANEYYFKLMSSLLKEITDPFLIKTEQHEQYHILDPANETAKCDESATTFECMILASGTRTNHSASCQWATCVTLLSYLTQFASLHHHDIYKFPMPILTLLRQLIGQGCPTPTEAQFTLIYKIFYVILLNLSSLESDEVEKNGE